MAKDWKTAQNKEKEFWTNIYLSEKKIIYTIKLTPEVGNFLLKRF
tara:strand:+ start:753 stop:887 length:135 start_codon:yes stop_codon:yes gene_type:complete